MDFSKKGKNKMEKRKYAVLYKTGNLNGLQWKEGSIPSPDRDEVLIRIHSIGLNFADIFAILGIYSATPPVPFTPGLEFSGIVEKTGENATQFRIGDRVMGVTRFGGYSSYILQKETYLFHIPDDWTMEEGAAFLVQALTAFYALFPLGNCKKGDIVLIHSAAGGVGLLANQFAKRAGAITIGSVGSKDKIPVLADAGFDHYVVRSSRLKKDIQAILQNRPLNLVLECIGGSVFQDSYELLAPTGRLIAYGSANFTPTGSRIRLIPALFQYITRPRIDPLRMISDNKTISGFNLIWLWDHVDMLKEYMKAIMEMKPHPQKVGFIMPWTDIQKALHLFRSGRTIGKVVINF